MMYYLKQQLINILFVFFCLQINAQTLDSANMQVTYKLKYLPDSNKKEWIKTDIFLLMIGKNISCFFSYLRFQRDSMFQESVKNGTAKSFLEDTRLIDKYPTGAYSSYHLFINYPNNKITTTDAIIADKFIYEEEIEKIKWNITNDTMNYLSYLCQKATCSFRGRNYIAWFAPSIPIDKGPYKFQGLPGLILKINDSKNNYVYECTNIVVLEKKAPIIINKNNFIKTTRSAFRGAFKNSFENPLQSLSNTNVQIRVVNADSNSPKADLSKGIPYNPIELE